MAKSGVTLSLLWQEYCQQCRNSQEIPYQYTQFCYYYRQFALTTRATMHLSRKPGEQMEVDWAGSQAAIIDRESGEILPAYIFVAVLSYSQYTYVEAFLQQDQECWIAGHVHAFEFFTGTTRIVTPDNLKASVDRVSWYNPVINKTYHEMAEHYGTAVIPARVRKSQDKPNAEGAVGVISTWILAALRQQQFFSLTELNSAIREKLTIFNRNPFQKKSGSRLSTFLEEDVRLTRQTIEVFFQNLRICSHPRLYGREGQYSTVTEHMPEEHQKYLQWNGERFISWAEKVGPHTVTVTKAILSSYKVEQQGYRGCLALLKSADRYSVSRLESACERALSFTSSPSYKNISLILKSGQDKLGLSLAVVN
jgi:transposase